jgi:CBS domain-containing protein
VLNSGCVTRKACDRKFPAETSEKTSVVTVKETTSRDTTVSIPFKGMVVNNKVTITKVNGLFTSPISVLNTPLASSRAWVDEGVLKHELVQKDTIVKKVLKDAIKDVAITTVKDTEKVKVDRVNYLTGWQWFQVWTGRILGLLLVICILLYFFVRQVMPRML